MSNINLEIAKMRSLMERMEKPMTAMQAMLNESSMLTEAVERKVKTPEEVFEILNQLKENKWVCVGYVTEANLNLPKVQRKNPATNRMKGYEDYETFGSEIGHEGEIGALVKITSYNYRYYGVENFNKKHNEFKQSANQIRPKYGLEPIKDKENDYHQELNYGKGVKAYGGDNEEKKGNFYVPFNSVGANVKSVVYIVDTNGNIEGNGLTEEQAKKYILAKKREIDGVSALRKMNVEEEKIQEYIKEIQALKFSYKQLIGNQILWIVGATDEQKIIYINDQLSKCINDININKEDFVNKARERYAKEINNVPTE